MSRAISPVTGKPYGLALVCRVWRLARSGVYRHLSVPPTAQRRGPLGAMSDDALTIAIEGVLASSPFHGERHRKVWARLRYAGLRTSMCRVLRLMRQHNSRKQRPLAPIATSRPSWGALIADKIFSNWVSLTRIIEDRFGRVMPPAEAWFSVAPGTLAIGV
jgi:putative transposase